MQSESSCDASQLRPRPPGYTWIEAAALPLGGLTAWRAVVTHAEARVDRTLLVPGAGGGVATFVIQIAAAVGARVLVTSSSAEKLERARGLGADGGADYREEDWPERLGPVDAVVDSVGGASGPEPSARSVPADGSSASATRREVAEVELAQVFLSWIRIQGTTMGSPREFDALLRHVAEARGAQWWTASSRSVTRRRRTSAWTRPTASARSSWPSTRAGSSSRRASRRDARHRVDRDPPHDQPEPTKKPGRSNYPSHPSTPPGMSDSSTRW